MFEKEQLQRYKGFIVCQGKLSAWDVVSHSSFELSVDKETGALIAVAETTATLNGAIEHLDEDAAYNWLVSKVY